MLKDIKCPLCKNQKSCAIMGIGDYAVEKCGMFNLIEKPIRTNADRIHAMTDEELAEFITNTQINTFTEVVGAINKMLGCKENTLRQIREEVSKTHEDMVQEQLEWLKQEAADEK